MDIIKRAENIDKLFVTSLNNNVFSGAAFVFSQRREGFYKRFSKYYGHAQLKPEKIQLELGSVFDLASLTKPLTTVPLLLVLFENKKIFPETLLKEIYPFCPDDKADITISQLMSHHSGFVAHRKFFHELIQLPLKERKKQLLKDIFKEHLTASPGQNHCYSDIGYMLLGLIIEKISGRELDDLAKQLIYEPAGLEEELFFPGLVPQKNNYVSTEKCSWSGKMLSGIVHDDNCRAVGGVTGHAGLFGTVHGVISLCEQFLDQWKGRGSKQSLYSDSILQRILEPVGNSDWTMGFNMVSKTGSSSGKYFSKKSIGHLGFTGTSFWIDPVKDCIVVLLTNRVHPSRENWKIKEFRPMFHDLLMGG